jgi:RHS repeat-associated protein
VTEWQNAYQGNPWNEVTPTSNGYIYNLRFPGQYYDQETTLNYNVNRYYESDTGRYDQADPLGWQGNQASLYAYVRGNTLTFIDPFGLLTQSQIAAIVFNETRSLSGQDVEQARIDVAHAIINASAKYGDKKRPPTASDVASVPKVEKAAYRSSLNATKTALCESKLGVDPTQGGTHFNLRPNNSKGPFFGSPKLPLTSQSGPFNNSYPTSDLPASGIYVDTYK